MGLLWGITTAFITKFTDHVRGESQHNSGTTALSVDPFGLYILVFCFKPSNITFRNGEILK